MYTSTGKGMFTAALLVLSAAGCVRTPTPIVGDAVTDAYHKQNIGKMVFSTEEILRDHPDVSKITTSFKDGDHIFARYYSDGPLANHFASFKTGDQEIAREVVSRFFVDGQENNGWGYREEIYDKIRVNSTRQVWLNPGEGKNPESKEDNLKDSMRWISFVKKLSPGKHTIRIELYTTAGSATSTTPLAVGEFTLERTSAPIKSGYSFDKIPSGMDDLVLEKAALDAIRKHAQAQKWSESFERVRIQSTEWGIERNELSGIILRRSLSISAFARWPDGHCTAQIFSFSQEHDGTGYSQTFQVQGVGEQREMDCE